MTTLPDRVQSAALSAPDTTVDDLATLASLRVWAGAVTPALVHQAILTGTPPAELAGAARVSVAQAHIDWHTWADRRLGSDGHGSIATEDYLRVHAAFARALRSGSTGGDGGSRC